MSGILQQGSSWQRSHLSTSNFVHKEHVLEEQDSHDAATHELY